ncbi:membrane-associated phospholipid phosphatase [Secundilactobacillus kimchicus JCM 15530]|uniref:Membrane-associated phospholipid phosphatase n=1 Tax=Secundilactobacillus kimchicus JCM 15530 TaxID=1302272 RepID=A0A0R1HR51_9LACO|nr:phosphatase PAP2 family protein [Secundilactobacillus kimchicus]KRK48918.1 membrane-associated phospholipid phosphatase [Secundilactobacillus kimchicus JCM 15530]
MMIVSERDRPFRLLLSGGLFVFLAIAVMQGSSLLLVVDDLGIQLAQKTQTGLKDGLFHLITTLASPTLDIVWVLVLAFFLWGFKYKIPALWAIGVMISGDVVAFIVKHLVGRARPIGHLAADDGFSFPSGHVFGMFLLVAMIWLLVLPRVKKYWQLILLRAILMIWVLLVAFSRVYMGAHFPSDTVAAMLLGYAWIQVCEYLYVSLAPRLKQVSFVKNSII